MNEIWVMGFFSFFVSFLFLVIGLVIGSNNPIETREAIFFVEDKLMIVSGKIVDLVKAIFAKIAKK